MVRDLETSRRIDVRSLQRSAFIVALAALFFALSYDPSMAWGEVERSAREGFTAELVAAARSNEAGNLRRQLAGVAIGLLGALAAASRGGFRLRVKGLLPWLSLAYCLLCALSILWSDDLTLTARRLAGFAALALAIVGALRLLPAGGVGRFAFLASAAYVLVGAVAEIATGAFRPFAEGYRFSGVYHPNTLASFCAVLVLAAVTVDAGVRRPWRLAAALAGMVILVLTRSRTALGCLLAALAARALVTARLSRVALAALAGAWMSCLAFLAAGEELLPRVGRALLMSRADSDPSTLSGRTLLWEELWRYAAQHPVLGHGLGGFWSGRRVYEVYATQRWPVSEAHSTYVEQLLDLGAVGLALYVLLVSAAIARAAALLRRTGDGAAAFLLCLLLHCAMVGFVESLQPTPHFLSYLSLCCVAFLAFRDPTTPGIAPPVEQAAR